LVDLDLVDLVEAGGTLPAGVARAWVQEPDSLLLVWILLEVRFATFATHQTTA
jgi:hypothetical protein